MDPTRFDTLARTLAVMRSRRGVTRALAGLTLGTSLSSLLGLAEQADARKKPCGPCRKRKNGKCKPKTDGTPCEKGGNCQRGKCKPPTCEDEITNGSESDVDCGGTCPRCANAKICGDRDDCASALCSISGYCSACTADPDCSSDADGECICSSGVNAGICVKKTGKVQTSCEACAPDEVCQGTFVGPVCYKRCGAP